MILNSKPDRPGIGYVSSLNQFKIAERVEKLVKSYGLTDFMISLKTFFLKPFKMTSFWFYFIF